MASTNQTLQLSPDLHQTVVYRLERRRDVLRLVQRSNLLDNLEALFEEGRADGLRRRERASWTHEFAIDPLSGGERI